MVLILALHSRASLRPSDQYLEAARRVHIFSESRVNLMADPAPRFLLFIPPAPIDCSLRAFKAAYDETVSQVLKEVSLQSEDIAGAAVLEIAFACPHLIQASQHPRSQSYNQTQRLIALLYKLIVVIAARDEINIEDDDGVDVRILPIAWASDQDASQYRYNAPVCDIPGLASSGRAWSHAFAVESEAGEAMVRAFVAAKQTAQAGVAPSHPQDATGWHHHVAVGGTFDHIHIGHKLLLTMTLYAVDITSASTVTIGLTGDELLTKKKYADVLESWDDRANTIADFCDSLLDYGSWPSSKTIKKRQDPQPNGISVDWGYPSGLVVKCTQIQDPFGPTITEERISAIILSAETRAGGEAINTKRSEKKWQPLEVFEVDVLDAAEDGVSVAGFEAKLSSTTIRQRLAAKKAS